MATKLNRKKAGDTINSVAEELDLEIPLIRKWVMQNKVCGDPSTFLRGPRGVIYLPPGGVDILRQLAQMAGIHQLANDWSVDDFVEMFTTSNTEELGFYLSEMDDTVNILEELIERVKSIRDNLHEKLYGDDSATESGF